MRPAVKRLGILATVILCGCSASPPPAAPAPERDDAPVGAALQAEGYAALFDAAALLGTPKDVDCTLSDGSASRCLSVTLAPAPSDFTIGPWCPRNIDDGPDVSGIWLDNGKVYDADGTFIQNLAGFYDDPTWQMFDPLTGRINVTDTQVACEAAARPDVDPQYQNHCVECEISYLPEGSSQTYILPLDPRLADSPTPLGRSPAGVAFSGVRLEGPAPVDAILAAHTLAPFDDCGGHVNTAVGYHIHAVTEDCLRSEPSADGHAAMIGLALDGFPIHEQLDAAGNTAGGLDACSGHEGPDGYHYHAGAPGENAILGCHSGPVGCALGSPDAVCDASAATTRRPPPGRRPPLGADPRPE